MTAHAIGTFDFGQILNIFASYAYVVIEIGQNEPWMYAKFIVRCLVPRSTFGHVRLLTCDVISNVCKARLPENWTFLWTYDA